jgi:hypothetical protein
MDNVSAHVSAHEQSHIIRTPSAQPAHYTAQQIASECSKVCKVSEVTIRTRWFDWIKKVAPEPLLKDTQGFTELAHALFAEFASVPKKQREQWVTEAKSRYAQEWSSDGIIDGELLPDEVGGALALLKTQTSSMQTQTDAERTSVETLIDQLIEIESDFSEGEIEEFRANGVRRGVTRFKIETQSELEAYNALKKRRMEGRQSKEGGK